MAHKFNPANIHKLENPRRKEILPPEKTLQLIGIKPGMLLADIGCGSGYFSIPAAKIVGENGRIYGTDIAQELIEYCENRAKEEGVTNNTTFLKGEETIIPLPDAAVDAAILANVLHEFLEPERSFQEILRILKPAGKIFIIEWKKQDTEMGPPVAERLSEAEVDEMLNKFGFTVQEHYDLGPTHYAVAGIKKKA